MKSKNERFLYVLWIAITILVFCLVAFLGHFSTFYNFAKRIESATFDIRQNIISKYKKNNENIVIIGVDDASYEYIMDKYVWPIPRKIWADTIEDIEKVNPKYIIFDLLFLKPVLNDTASDMALVKKARKFDNVYFSMNFDNYSDEIRKSPVFKDDLKVKIQGDISPLMKFYSFQNARSVMPALEKATNNIASINVIRDDDGIIRNATPVFMYKDEYYPNLTLKVALDMLNKNKNEVKIEGNNIIFDNGAVIPLKADSTATLNWYGKNKTFKNIPLWEVLKAVKNNDTKFLEENFKDKIIYIGTTAVSLTDVKSVPVDYNFAGVEIHATFLNNILDNNFIKKTNFEVDLIISIILCFIIGFAVLKIQNIYKTVMFLLFAITLYLALSVVLMLKFNLWIGIVLPFIAMILTFIGVYVEKYLLVTKDYEQTYKLAVTDGLTQLYNHRYFQEQMLLAVNNYHRYGNKFSLILIDIDFFKKFNDTYGHQSGDCVLRQVANILKKNSRVSYIACRYGGEEMSVILLNTNKDEAILTANKICNAVRENKFILSGGEAVSVTISVGVATIGNDGAKAQELIEYSDKCLYKAKENGRNQVQYSID